MMRTNFFNMLALSVYLAGFQAIAGDNWPEFRGPTEQGHTTEGTKLPLTWSETKNIAWKTEIKGKAWSSPGRD